MTPVELLVRLADGVVRDAERSGGVAVVITGWDDPRESVAAVVHERGVVPTTPRWEAIGLTGDGDCLALHPPRQDRLGRWDVGPWETATGQVVTAVQELVLVGRWRRGLDPTWPVCPEHSGAHPARVDTALPTAWTCPRGGGVRVPVGSLG